MSVIRQMGQGHGITRAKIIHNAGTPDEEVCEVDALIQGEAGFFEVDTPIFEGDLVEVPDPRRGPDGVERRLARKVKVNNMGPRNMHHIHVEWGAAPPPRVAPVRRLTFENLHSAVQEAAGALFADGHYESAVSEAFKSIEVRVREVTGISKSGAALMGDAFKMDGSVLDVSMHEGSSGEDEREGFIHIFRGAMLGVRNPGAHELFRTGDPQQALEYLGFASLLHRRVDAALDKRC
jgi:uncharacterized protein (TIGR02391 family)